MSQSTNFPSTAATERVLSLANHLKDSLKPDDDLENAKSKMSIEYKFAGWMGKDKNAIGNMVWEEFTPKTWTEDDVDIKITHSGICGSDCHVSTAPSLSSKSIYWLLNVDPEIWLGPDHVPMLCWPRDCRKGCQSRQERQARQSWRPCRCWSSIGFLQVKRLPRVLNRTRKLLPGKCWHV